MESISQASRKVESLLAGISILLFAAMLLGPSMTYFVHFAAFLVACRLLVVSGDWRVRTVAYFRTHAGIWVVVVLFSLVFLVPCFVTEKADPADAAELKWVLVFLALLMPAAAIFRCRGRGRLLKCCGIAVIVVVLLSFASGLVQFLMLTNPAREALGDGVNDFGRRATGFLRNPIPFGHVMGAVFWIAVAGGLVGWFSGRRRRLVQVSAVIAAVALLSVILSQTRGAWLAIALVALLSVLLLRGRARRIWIVSLSAACAAGVVLVALSPEVRTRLLSGFDVNETSNRLRLELWEANFEILKDHPFGIGYNTNDQFIHETFAELGFEAHEWMGHSHNEFVEIAVGSGWIGLALYLWLTGWILLRAIRAFRGVGLTREPRDPWAAFLLLSSILVQLFVNACALTDQMSTPGRFLLCMAWAVVLVVPVETGSGDAFSRGRSPRPQAAD